MAEFEGVQRIRELSDAVERRCGVEVPAGVGAQQTLVKPPSCPINRASSVTVKRNELIVSTPFGIIRSGHGAHLCPSSTERTCAFVEICTLPLPPASPANFRSNSSNISSPPFVDCFSLLESDGMDEAAIRHSRM